jgi:hypothetical protein
MEEHLKDRDEQSERNQGENNGKDVKKDIQGGITPIGACIT